MLGLRAGPQPCTELPTRAMSRLLKHCCRQGLTRLYRNVAETSHSQPLLNMISLQDDQGRTSAHKALEKKTEKGNEILELILRRHPKCGEILDHKGKGPTDG